MVAARYCVAFSSASTDNGMSHVDMCENIVLSNISLSLSSSLPSASGRLRLLLLTPPTREMWGGAGENIQLYVHRSDVTAQVDWFQTRAHY